ncbi:PAS domain-containing protein [Sulfurimonas sp.]|uniref:PAS domain-containing protein n=1 Tax=Sulfurimonas sp. TaxID=2022749 RepID=UPI0025CE3BE5|nr:PAS domain-containing protein [Sulfurimonas sp.]MBW6489301.1 PAS domain-containing protein [Sulfurimonas sp.]
MKLKSDTMFLIAIFIFFTLAVTLFSYYEYRQNKIELYHQIDEKLLASANGASLVLPPDFHSRAVEPSSIAKTEDDSNIDRLSRFAKWQKVVYIYTMIQKNGKIYFTASSATDEERKSGINLTRYFDSYDGASDELKNVFRTQKKQFAEYTDKWGTFRSVFIPMKSQEGALYVVGADIKIDTIKQTLNEKAINLLLHLAVAIMLTLPFFIWRLWHLWQLNSRLSENNDVLGQEVEEGEKKLNQHYIELQAILDATKESIFLLDKDGIILTINSTAATRMHKEPSELLGRCVYNFFPLN